ncbi:DUF2165 domain-containing protein [Aliidiomarina haloalkalitolerans]|uniref:DUF2165 domain-containing protein n=1 Tax=Aliidiomarina haloalkalitolerans TaxID=859059 RepID=A0A432VUS6_9GAMM|nr:DUF2165 domain-containing protein [Aliidiomarina haloalkalitolerans]RUO20283.1 hypothetical protein CWE06_06560 [Aliidiomarina haloalkalitolerans]
MALRTIKILLVAAIGFMCLFYALQNIANLDAAHGFVAAVFSNAGHEIYPNTFFFAIESSVIVWICLILIITLEALAGIVALAGAFAMLRARREEASLFNESKYFAYLGAGIALLVWFGLFTVLGGAFFQMWQTPLGGGSLEGSFQYLGSIALVTLFVSMPDH